MNDPEAIMQDVDRFIPESEIKFRKRQQDLDVCNENGEKLRPRVKHKSSPSFAKVYEACNRGAFYTPEEDDVRSSFMYHARSVVHSILCSYYPDIHFYPGLSGIRLEPHIEDLLLRATYLELLQRKYKRMNPMGLVAEIHRMLHEEKIFG
jgi:hypothetical protein